MFFNKKLNYATGKDVKIGALESGWENKLIDSRIMKGIGLVNSEDELMLKVSADCNDLNGNGTSSMDLILRFLRTR